MSRCLFISNIGTYITGPRFESFIREKGVSSGVVIKDKMKVFGYIVFDTDEQLNDAQLKLNNAVFKDKQGPLRASIDNRKLDVSKELNRRERKSIVKVLPPFDSMKAPKVTDSVTPWHSKPYSEQLRDKQMEMITSMANMSSKLIQYALRSESAKYVKNLQRHPVGEKRNRDGGKVEGNVSVVSEKAEGEKNDDGVEVSDLPEKKEALVPRKSYTLDHTFTSKEKDLLPSYFHNRSRFVMAPVCPVAPIIASPQPVGYRNKVEYSIGPAAVDSPAVIRRREQEKKKTSDAITPSAETTPEIVSDSPSIELDADEDDFDVPVCVGFRLGSFGTVRRVSNSPDLANIPQVFFECASALEAFLKDPEQNQLAYYNDEYHHGFWRTLMLRQTVDGKLMAEIMYNPNIDNVKPSEKISSKTVNNNNMGAIPASSNAIDDSAMVIRSHLDRVKDLFVSLDAHSIQFISYSGPSKPDEGAPREVVYGPSTIVDSMCGYRFHVAPDAFFQVNRPLAELLYSLAITMAIGSQEDAFRWISKAVGTDNLKKVLALTTGINSKPEFVKFSDYFNSSHFVKTSSGTLEVNPYVFPDSASMPNFVPEKPLSYDDFKDIEKGLPTSLKNRTILFDVCCGTGTIGILSSKHVSHVIGVDIVASAIEDAKRNVALNNVNNCTFIAGRAEIVLQYVIDLIEGRGKHNESSNPVAGASIVDESIQNELSLLKRRCFLQEYGSTSEIDENSKEWQEFKLNYVAILDPPRGGLHPSVISSLRTCKGLNKVVYISCNPSGSLVNDMVSLCTMMEKGKHKGVPLSPVVAVPFDMFPHTPHCEMITLFRKH